MFVKHAFHCTSSLKQQCRRAKFQPTLAFKVNYRVVSAATGARTQPLSPVLLCVAAWAVPGAGHLWLGRRSKGLLFLAALVLMFTIGLAIHGQLFSFGASEPLGSLAAFANLGIGIVYFVAVALGYGAGDVRAVSYEYRQHVPDRGRTPQPPRRHRRV